MVELIKLTLENEMDLVLAQKKASKLSEVLKLSLSTQATFATAIAELCRVVIDHTDTGVLFLGLSNEKNRYSLSGIIEYKEIEGIKIAEESYYYVKKLRPFFNVSSDTETAVLEISINLPRSANLNPERVSLLKDLFEQEPPMSAYEEIKKKNGCMIF